MLGGYIIQKYSLRLECDDLGDGKELAWGQKIVPPFLLASFFQFRINLGV
jgi:hypothetical protein